MRVLVSGHYYCYANSKSDLVNSSYVDVSVRLLVKLSFLSLFSCIYYIILVVSALVLGWEMLEDLSCAPLGCNQLVVVLRPQIIYN